MIAQATAAPPRLSCRRSIVATKSSNGHIAQKITVALVFIATKEVVRRWFQSSLLCVGLLPKRLSAAIVTERSRGVDRNADAILQRCSRDPLPNIPSVVHRTGRR